MEGNNLNEFLLSDDVARAQSVADFNERLENGVVGLTPYKNSLTREPPFTSKPVLHNVIDPSCGFVRNLGGAFTENNAGVRSSGENEETVMNIFNEGNSGASAEQKNGSCTEQTCSDERVVSAEVASSSSERNEFVTEARSETVEPAGFDPTGIEMLDGWPVDYRELRDNHFENMKVYCVNYRRWYAAGLDSCEYVVLCSTAPKVTIERTYSLFAMEEICRKAYDAMKTRPTIAPFFTSFAWAQLALERKIEFTRSDFVRQSDAVRAKSDMFVEKCNAQEGFLDSSAGHFEAESLYVERENLSRKETRFYEALGFPLVTLRDSASCAVTGVQSTALAGTNLVKKFQSMGFTTVIEISGSTISSHEQLEEQVQREDNNGNGSAAYSDEEQDEGAENCEKLDAMDNDEDKNVELNDDDDDGDEEEEEDDDGDEEEDDDDDGDEEEDDDDDDGYGKEDEDDDDGYGKEDEDDDGDEEEDDDDDDCDGKEDEDDDDHDDDGDDDEDEVGADKIDHEEDDEEGGNDAKEDEDEDGEQRRENFKPVAKTTGSKRQHGDSAYKRLAIGGAGFSGFSIL